MFYNCFRLGKILEKIIWFLNQLNSFIRWCYNSRLFIKTSKRTCNLIRFLHWTWLQQQNLPRKPPSLSSMFKLWKELHWKPIKLCLHNFHTSWFLLHNFRWETLSPRMFIGLPGKLQHLWGKSLLWSLQWRQL